ncbi:MAG: O-antigen ligase family protein [Candidatus Omnitrophica bacterium]|nr:O-antigen ligase family protein [Candidatus Omnitrophota bacterium]
MERPGPLDLPVSRLSIDPAAAPTVSTSHRHGLSLPHWTRTPWAYRLCEGITAGLIYAMVVFSPWAFGTTQEWSIWVMNFAGFALGILLLTKWIIRWRTGYQPSRWGAPSMEDDDDEKRKRQRWSKGITVTLAVLTILVLLYCLVSAVNARAVFHWDTLGFEYHDHYIAWLPHSYDSSSTWFVFWEYLGLALTFWATRDWLLGKTRKERQKERIESEGEPNLVLPRHSNKSWQIPGRLEVLLWILCLNAALLGLEGILQRLDGSGKLLWMVRPRINQEAAGQFGPYAYRGNAAQYYNLVWPICLGFWWTLRQKARRAWTKGVRVGSGPQMLLLPCVVITAACPIISTSRGGAIVAAGGLVSTTVLLLLADRRGHWLARLGIFLLFLVTLGMSTFLGWDQLEDRLKHVFNDDWSGRVQIYENARQMARDFPVLGSGPGTFAPLYQLYRKVGQEWMAQVHDDWLETRITFGWLGFSLVLWLLVTVLLHWRVGTGIESSWVFLCMLWIAVGGCLVHAKYDFPFQIHSVLALFLMHCSLLSCLARKA